MKLLATLMCYALIFADRRERGEIKENNWSQSLAPRPQIHVSKSPNIFHIHTLIFIYMCRQDSHTEGPWNSCQFIFTAQHLACKLSVIPVTGHCHPVHADCLAVCEEVCLVHKLCMHGYVTNVNVNVPRIPPQHEASCLCALWLNHVAVQDESFSRSVSQPILAPSEGHLVTGCLAI